MCDNLCIDYPSTCRDPVYCPWRAGARVPLSVYDPLYPRSYYRSHYLDYPYNSPYAPYADPLYRPVDTVYRSSLYRDSLYRDSLARDSLARD